MTIHEMTERRVSKGFTWKESAELLSEGFRTYRGNILANFLYRHDFATMNKADKIAAEYDEYLARY